MVTCEVCKESLEVCTCNEECDLCDGEGVIHHDDGQVGENLVPYETCICQAE